MNTPARFGELLQQAHSHLTMAAAINAADSTNQYQPQSQQDRDLADLAGALHELGTAVGPHTPATTTLHNALAEVSHGTPFGQRDTAAATPGTNRATTLIRAAADLLNTTGRIVPTPDDPYPPRAPHLTDNTTRAGAWSTIAALTESLTSIAAAHPDTLYLARALTPAAAAVPRAPLPVPMSTATARARVQAPGSPGELASLIHYVATTGERVSRPNIDGHPAGTLADLADFAWRAARTGVGPQWQARARAWQTVRAALAAIDTPQQRQLPGERWALRRATRLLTNNPDPRDAAQARAVACNLGECITPAILAMGEQNSTARVHAADLPPTVASTTQRMATAAATGSVVPLGRPTAQRLKTILTHTRAEAGADIAAMQAARTVTPTPIPNRTPAGIEM